MPDKLFTKSAFKIAMHCPMQAYYYRNPDAYENQSANDDFLKSLAEGGFQVGELAKIYGEVPSENDLEGCSGYDKPLKRTRELFKQENVNIAEAAFRYGDCFVRADVVKKDGHKIKLIEVKAKSWDPKIDFVSIAQGGKYKGKQTVNSDIRDYLYDVAFQKWVVENALKTDYPNEPWIVQAYLMMPDKSKVNTIPSLNGLFKVRQEEFEKDGRKEKRAKVEMASGALEILKKPHEHILTPFPVDNDCKLVIEGKTAEQVDVLGMPFVLFIEEKSKWYVNNEKHDCSLGSKCFKCPFTLSKEGEENGLESGFEECWCKVPKLYTGDLEKHSIKALNGAGLTHSPNTKDDWIRSGIYYIDDIDESVYPRKNDREKTGWSNNERKWIQIDGVKKNQKEPIILKDELRAEMKSWDYPLHMIDFETTASALPFFVNTRPYEQIAFQFSHHIIHKDGRIEHAWQFLKTQPGKFPNFDFIKELKEQLGKDGGTIFRYATHENSILRAIRQQLLNSEEPEKDELVAFIESITHPTSEEVKACKKSGIPATPGNRDMIDLCEIVKRFYWHPDMKGSNSIKDVLPAILKSGTYIQEKYSKPIYGSEIKSQNYKEHPIALIVKDDKGEIQSPYKVLPQLKEIQDNLIDTIASQESLNKEELRRYAQSSDDDEIDVSDETRIKNGGLPLVLFRSFQALDPNVDWEKELTAANLTSDALTYKAIREGLLKYCELDTMAMVLVWEYFNNVCKE
jgi:hypothetical protein